VRHVLWIGGPPACGKTVVATLLARRHGLRLYSADTRTWEHRDRAMAAGNAAALRWESLTPAERWERASVPEMFEMSLHRERGAMVLEDLRALPATPLTVAEGSTLPASALSSGIAERSQAVWLIPTAEFQRERLAAAGAPPGHIRLYRFLHDVIEREAREHGAPTLLVDGSTGVAETAAEVERLFAGAIAAGPRARTLEERQALLRERNEAVVAQARGYNARPWVRGEADVAVMRFLCECGDPACDRDVRLPVGELAAGPVIVT
jgi:hypothetical protein